MKIERIETDLKYYEEELGKDAGKEMEHMKEEILKN